MVLEISWVEVWKFPVLCHGAKFADT
jgi:hypothetical protein